MTQAWAADLGGPVGYPLIAQQLVFVVVAHLPTSTSPNAGAAVVALDLPTGALAWGPVELGGTASSWAGAAYDAGRIYTLNHEGQLQARTAASGAVLWSTQLGPATDAPPTAASGSVYATAGDRLDAIRQSDGTLRWSVPIGPGVGRSSPTVTSAGVYLAGGCHDIDAFDAATGALRWSTPRQPDCSAVGVTAPMHQGRLYVRSDDGQDGGVVIDASAGVRVGAYRADQPEAFDGTTGFFSYGSTLKAQNLENEAVRWSFNGDCDLLSAPLVANGNIYIGSTQGHLYAVDETSGRAVWRADVGSPIGDPGEVGSAAGAASPGLAAGDGHLVVPANHRLVVFRAALQGTVPPISPASAITFPASGALSGSPASLAAGSGNDLWLTESPGNRIAHVSATGTATEFTLPTPDRAPRQIAIGPDGAAWFTESAGTAIGRLTSDGGLHEYAIPSLPLSASATTHPYGITVGPDGAIWFTLDASSAIGRMTPDGATVSEFAIPAGPGGPARPHAIVSGPDGNLWFTEPGRQRIGRLTRAGVLIEFALPFLDPAEQPEGIVAGSDGNLWFTLPGAASASRALRSRKLGRITPAGAVTYFETPSPSSSPMAIAAGPDGALWFTEAGRFSNTPYKVGRITTAGAVTEYWLPARAGPAVGITTLKNGTLWFAANSGTLGRIDPAGDACPPS